MPHKYDLQSSILISSQGPVTYIRMTGQFVPVLTVHTVNVYARPY